ncbi:CoA-binding protein [Metabacillus herbersteinensis]|uniref:CoA-binding protein n=1 Tax=Metabacillus herbersteinensis TaxID=283816 RepID=A0ABV6GI48_9BACI
MEELKHLFYPKSIAIIGASSSKQTLGTKKLKTLQEFGFDGRIYVIHPTAEEINGIKAYPSIKKVPETIDYAYIAVPKERVVDVIHMFHGKVKFAHIITSGFSEIGNYEKELEVLAAARRAKVRLVGPNCIGLYCPEGKITFSKRFSQNIGQVSVFSQSGGLASDIGIRGNNRGLKYSKIISAGNCVDLGPVDFLEYFINDPKTKVIGMYIESIDDGKRFIEVLKKNAGSKPIVLLKGGRTYEGAKAAASHTGAMANNYEIIKGICTQYGVILVNDYEDLIDTLILLDSLSTPLGEKTVLLGMGGGATVSAIDACEENGISVPEFSTETQHALLNLNLPDGYSLKNPIDTPAWTLMAENGRVIKTILNTIMKKENFDHLIVHLNIQVVEGTFGRKALDNLVEAVSELNQLPLNVMIVLRNELAALEEPRVQFARKLSHTGVPVLFNLNSAIKALSKVTQNSKIHSEKKKYINN